VAPSSLSLLTASFAPGREGTRAVAWYGATAGIGASLGLVIGGALAHWISWRAGFFINFPIGAAMILLAPRYLPASPRSTGRFDAAGAVTATLGMGALVFGITSSADAGWLAPQTILAVGAGAVLLAVFVANEWRAGQPIMPLRLFASRERSGAYLARMLYMGAMIGFFYFTTQFLQEVLGCNPLQAGIANVTAVDSGAASGLVNTAHQLGSSLGLAVLVTAAAATATGGARAAMAGHVSAALTAGSVMLALCLVASLALIVPAEIAARAAKTRVERK
jgi:MFS family permease